LISIHTAILIPKKISGGDASALSATPRYLKNATVIDDALQALRPLSVLIRKMLS
jgi:hypothetical protein